MAYSMASGPNSTGGIGNPVTPQSYVVINGQFDRTFFQRRIAPTSGGSSRTPWNNVVEDNFDMCKHELAFSFNDAMLMPRGPSNGVNDPELRYFTSANGIPVSSSSPNGTSVTEVQLLGAPQGDAQEYLRRKIRSRLNFIGVNLTSLHGVSTGNTHASVAVAGAVTVINTGPHRIDIGNRVVWDIPLFDSDPASASIVASYGMPQTKKQFMTLPWEKAQLNSTASTLDYLFRHTNGKSASQDADAQVQLNLTDNLCRKIKEMGIDNSTDLLQNAESRTVLEPFLKGFIEIQRELEFRVIGTALTRAEPGAPFDMLLRYNRMA